MKKVIRKLSPFFLIGLIFTTVFFNETTVFAGRPVVDTLTLTVKFPDAVGEHNPEAEPSTVDLVIDMIRDPGKYNHRSGWSASVYECVVDRQAIAPNPPTHSGPIHLPTSSVDSTVPLTINGQSGWRYNGMTDVIDSTTGNIIGSAYRYYHVPTGRYDTMINPGSVSIWAEKFGGNPHNVIKDTMNKRYNVVPPAPKSAFQRIPLSDVIISSGASYTTPSGTYRVTPSTRVEYVEKVYWKPYKKYMHQTEDSHRDYNAQDLKDEIIAQYNEEIYELAVENNAIFSYDPSSKIPDRFLAEQDQYGPTGRYTIYRHLGRSNSNQLPKPCNEGDIDFTYKNNDFFVTSTFQVVWEDEGPEGTSTGEAYWELQRSNPNQPSNLFAYSSFTVPTERHVATRNPYHSVNLGSNYYYQVSPIQFTTNAMNVKNHSMLYSFGYEYTNKMIGWQNSIN